MDRQGHEDGGSTPVSDLRHSRWLAGGGGSTRIRDGGAVEVTQSRRKAARKQGYAGHSVVSARRRRLTGMSSGRRRGGLRLVLQLRKGADGSEVATCYQANPGRLAALAKRRATAGRRRRSRKQRCTGLLL